MLIRDGSSDVCSSDLGQGVAPQAATVSHFRDLGLDMVPGTGLLPACVPGAFGAWLLLLRDHGTMSLAEVLAPAIHYAENGYPLVSRITNALQAVESLFRNEWPSSSEIYFPKPGRPKPGRSEEHTSELQSLMRNSYAVFCLKKKTTTTLQQIE